MKDFTNHVFSQDQHKLRCLVVLTKECIANWQRIDNVILFSCQPLVICIASPPSYASLTPSTVRCVRHAAVPPTLALSVDSEVVRERPSRLPSLSRPLHLHEAPPSLRLPFHGTRGGAVGGSNLELTAVPLDNVPLLSLAGEYVLTPALDCSGCLHAQLSENALS